MTFARLTRGDWLAAVAALALLLVMSFDWYSTDAAEQARRDADNATTSGAQAGEPGRQAKEDAQIIRTRHEKNAWQAAPFADRVILLALLAAVILAIAAAWLRAANKRFEPPVTPSAAATVAGMAALILLAARIIQKPSVDAGAVIKFGAPLGLVCVGALVIGARFAWNAERDGSAWDRGPGDDATPGEAAEGGDEDSAGRVAIRGSAEPFDHEPSGAAGPGSQATAVVAPPPEAEEPPPPAVAPPPRAEQPPPPADDPVDEPFGPPTRDGSAAERERRRAQRAQRRGRGRSGKRRRGGR